MMRLIHLRGCEDDVNICSWPLIPKNQRQQLQEDIHPAKTDAFIRYSSNQAREIGYGILLAHQIEQLAVADAGMSTRQVIVTKIIVHGERIDLSVPVKAKY